MPEEPHWGEPGEAAAAPPPYVPPETGGCGGERVLRDEFGEPRPCVSPGCGHASSTYLDVTDEFVCHCHAPMKPV